MRHGLLHAGVGVEDDLAGAVVDQPDRQWLDQFAAAGLGQHPATEPALEQVQLGLAEAALEAEQELVLEVKDNGKRYALSSYRRGSTGIWVSVSRGDGSFAAPVKIADSAGTPLLAGGNSCGAYTTTRLGDFDADGRTDIVRIVEGQMSVLRQTGNHNRDRLLTVRDEGAPWDRETVK